MKHNLGLQIKQLFLFGLAFYCWGAYAQAPTWSVNPNQFQYNMSVTAVLDLNCTELTSPSNQLGAFVNDTLRGTGFSSSVISGRYQTSILVYSDSVNGENVTFRFYDKASDSIYASIDTIAFQDNAIYGNPTVPIVVRTNHRPTQISLSNDSLLENQASGIVVGSFSTTDVDLSQTHTYSLIAGTGDINNALFSFTGSDLVADFSANFEVKNIYSIRVRVTDSEGCSLDSAITIFIKDLNDAPTAMALSNNLVDENQAANTVIGSLTTTDSDANESFTYSFVAGTGGADNNSFNINGSEVRANASFNFEDQSIYSIRLEVADKANNIFVDTFKISVNDINDVPSDVIVTADSIEENKAKNTIIATLSTEDEDAGQSYAYSFDDVAGNDNANFNIVGNTLRTREVFDFEATDIYFVYIETNDLNGGTFTKQISIRVIDANDVPSDVQLSTTSVNENMSIGSFGARILSTDQDALSTFTYTLVNGVGDADNADFKIRNDTLLTNKVLDLNAQATHAIRIQTNDGNGGTLSKAFTINVKDINNIPTNITLSNNIIPENTTQGSEVGFFTSTDADAGDIHIYSLVAGVGDSNNTAFSISANKLLTNKNFDVNLQNNYSVRVQTDDGFGGVFQKAFSVTITNSNDNPTDIQLSNDSVFESLVSNTLIGSFSTIDPDTADTHTYSFASGTNDNASFVLFGNELRTAVTFNFEVKNSYFVAIQANDGNGGTFTKQFNIGIKDTTDGPTDITLNNNLIAENSSTNFFVGILNSVDEDANDSFTYQLVSGINATDNNAFQLSNDSLFSKDTFNYEVRQTYFIRIKSEDASNLATEKFFLIQVTNANDAPTDLELTNRNVSEDSPLNSTVGVFTTLDPDTANTHSYSLVAGIGDNDNDDFTITGNALKTDTVFDVNVRTAYSIRVRTTDLSGASYEEVIAITITNANDAPTNIALSPSSINENLPSNTLVGNFSTTDADANDNHIYTFANLSANDNSNFAIVGSELRTSSSFDFETKSVYFIQIQTSDGNGGTYSRQLFVNVNDTNDNPTDLTLSGNSVDEKQGNGEFIGRLSSVDQDAADEYTYSLVNGNGDDDNVDFTISNDSLFSNATFDVLIKTQLSVRIQTTDTTNKSFEKSFSIFVQNVNDAPNNIQISNASVPENTVINSVIGSFSTTDIDPMQTFTYQLVSGNGDTDNGNFSINGNELKSNVGFDFNTQNSHDVRIRSTDQGGLSFEKEFTINITNSNDAPTDIVLTPNEFKENLLLNTTVGLFSSEDKDANDSFSYSFVNQNTNDNSAFIIAGNELKTGTDFDFETKNLYVIEVETRDNAGLTYNRQLILNVLDSNDAPTNLMISVDSIEEKSPIGTFVAELSTTDSDAVDNFTYSLVAGQGAIDNDLFRINGNLLEIDSVLDFNDESIRNVRIQTADKNGRTVASSFVIRIINKNDLPTAIQLSDTIINENAAIGTRVGGLTTEDEDLSDTFSYTLVTGMGDNDNEAFAIAGNELISNKSFDFETQNSFNIRIRTTDQFGETFEQAFTIELTNGNEAPTIETQFFTIDENKIEGTELGTVVASDKDANDSFTFRILGNQTDFLIDKTTGVLTSANQFDYENQFIYLISIEVTDFGGLKDTAEINIEIKDEVEGTLPSAAYFSPNGDGRNDNWSIQNVELYSNYKLLIFSVNGELVFEKSSNYNNDWDGTFGGQQLPDGIYYYYFENTLNNSKNFKGTITLKR